MKKRSDVHALLVFLLATAITACGGGGGSSPDGTSATDQNSLITGVVNSAPATVCPNGGITVNVGGSTQYVCNDATNDPNGTNNKKYTSLVSIVSEPSGTHCAYGGIRIDVGLDKDSNGILDPSEVTSTNYVCNGSNGINGTNGLTSLMSITSQPAGPVCAAGGLQVTSGPDQNRNGVLDPSEVTSTKYVCNGTNGTNGLTSLLNMVSEPAGVHCAYGGLKISSGLDTNTDGILESSEITSSNYVCNGAPGPDLNWIDVTTTWVQAVSNTGYMADSTSQVMITLPLSPKIGDIVRVSGIESGGWKIAQNAEQTIMTGDIETIGENWVRANMLPQADWWSVASSADGTRLVAFGFVYTNLSTGESDYFGIFTSSDSGVSWTKRYVSSDFMYSMASSADGTRLVAVAEVGRIYTSSDAGVTWNETSAPQGNWWSVASSADGRKLVAAANDGFYTSSDWGFSWTKTYAASTPTLWSVASSADGTKLVAIGSGGILTSSDSGASWTKRSPPSNTILSSVASSADGKRLVAVNHQGEIYTSSDSGANWTRTFTSAPGTNNFWSVASSADGTRLVTVSQQLGTYISINSGVSWTETSGPGPDYPTVALSSDGTKIVVATTGPGGIYTSSPASIQNTTVGTAGSISGGEFDAIELQYIGDNTFMVLSHEGYFLVK